MIFYCQIGDKEWIVVDYLEDLKSKGLYAQSAKPGNPIYCNGGCLYIEMFTSGRSNLILVGKHNSNVLDISSTTIFRPTHYFQDHTSRFFASNNEMFRIETLFYNSKVIAVAVFKFDCSQRVWEKVESMKDRVLFISQCDSPIACQEINQESKGGQVYITLPGKKFVWLPSVLLT